MFVFYFKIFILTLIFFTYKKNKKNFFYRTSLGFTGLPLFRHSAVILEGIMLIVGGNSHNESSKSRINDCYSSQILAFDIGNDYNKLMHYCLIKLTEFN